MNKSLLKKIFVPVVIVGAVIILITMLLINSETMLNDLLIGLIIWIPLCGVISLAITILDEKMKLNLDNKISNLIKAVKTKTKSKSKTVKTETTVKPEVVTKPEISPEVKLEKDPFEVTIEEVELGVYNLDFGDIIPPVKVDKPISSVVAFSNESVKNEFQAFCDNGFKPVDKKKVSENTKKETEFVVVKKPAVIKKPKNIPSVDKKVETQPVVIPQSLVKKTEIKLNPEIPVKPVEKKKELPDLVFIPDDISNEETVAPKVSIPMKNVTKIENVTKSESAEIPNADLVVPQSQVVKEEKIEVPVPQPEVVKEEKTEIPVPQPKVVKEEKTEIPVPQPKVVKEEKTEIPVPQPKVIKEEVKPKTVKSPFKIPAFKFNPKNKTIQQNEEAIFNPVAMKPKELDIPENPPKLVITDERLVKIVKHPEIMTPAEVKLVNSNVDLKKRYYEFMTALFDEDED